MSDPSVRPTASHEVTDPGLDITRSAQLPSFCGPRPLSGVAAVSLLTGVLVAIGTGAWPGWGGLSLLLAWSLLLGLFCTLCVCLVRAWLQRLPTREAWLLAWLVVFLAATALSYVAGVIGTVLGLGPGREHLALFMLRSVLATALVAVALFRYLFIRALWDAEAKSEAEARVQALQARIRPHFLFNALNTIASLIPDQPEAAERATEDLADLFRAGMRRADQPLPLAEELALARKYLDMECRRLGERLQVDWQVESLPETARILPLTLQPLLENAVGHGIQGRPGGGRVRVFGRREGDSIVITVTNPLALRPGQSGHGMALSNIRARLRLSYGDRASLVTGEDGDSFYAVLSVPHAPADR